MILDNFTQWRRYACLGQRFEQAFQYLAGINAATPIGRYEVAGMDVFALVQTYPTRPVEQCRFEAHRQYADIQFILTGRERIFWAPLAALTLVTEPYNAEKDIAFFANPASATPLQMGPGQFAVFFPEDGHAPGAMWDVVGEVRKVVVKIRV